MLIRAKSHSRTDRKLYQEIITYDTQVNKNTARINTLEVLIQIIEFNSNSSPMARTARHCAAWHSFLMPLAILISPEGVKADSLTSFKTPKFSQIALH